MTSTPKPEPEQPAAEGTEQEPRGFGRRARGADREEAVVPDGAVDPRDRKHVRPRGVTTPQGGRTRSQSR